MNLKNHLPGDSNFFFSPKKENKTKHRKTDDLNDELGIGDHRWTSRRVWLVVRGTLN